MFVCIKINRILLGHTFLWITTHRIVTHFQESRTHFQSSGWSVAIWSLKLVYQFWRLNEMKFKIEVEKYGKIPSKSNNLLNLTWRRCCSSLMILNFNSIYLAGRPSFSIQIIFFFFSIKSQNTISIIFQSACIDITLGSIPYRRESWKILPFQPLFGQQMFDQCNFCIHKHEMTTQPYFSPIFSLSFLKSKFTQVKNEYKDLPRRLMTTSEKDADEELFSSL